MGEGERDFESILEAYWEHLESISEYLRANDPSFDDDEKDVYLDSNYRT